MVNQFVEIRSIKQGRPKEEKASITTLPTHSLLAALPCLLGWDYQQDFQASGLQAIGHSLHQRGKITAAWTIAMHA